MMSIKLGLLMGFSVERELYRNNRILLLWLMSWKLVKINNSSSNTKIKNCKKMLYPLLPKTWFLRFLNFPKKLRLDNNNIIIKGAFTNYVDRILAFLTTYPPPVKVHIFWEGQKILLNLHRKFDCYYIGQIYGGEILWLSQNIWTLIEKKTI